MLGKRAADPADFWRRRRILENRRSADDIVRVIRRLPFTRLQWPSDDIENIKRSMEDVAISEPLHPHSIVRD